MSIKSIIFFVSLIASIGIKTFQRYRARVGIVRRQLVGKAVATLMFQQGGYHQRIHLPDSCVHVFPPEEFLIETTYFGLPVVESDGTKFVRLSDIKKLPFFEFWKASSKGSTMREDSSGGLVFLVDWELFSQLFIETGRHRYQT